MVTLTQCEYHLRVKHISRNHAQKRKIVLTRQRGFIFFTSTCNEIVKCSSNQSKTNYNTHVMCGLNYNTFADEWNYIYKAVYMYIVHATI